MHGAARGVRIFRPLRAVEIGSLHRSARASDSRPTRKAPRRFRRARTRSEACINGAKWKCKTSTEQRRGPRAGRGSRDGFTVAGSPVPFTSKP